MAMDWVLPIRGVQVTLSLAVLGMMAYVANWWTTHWEQMSPIEVNFLIFAPAWSLPALVALIIVPRKVTAAHATIPALSLLFIEFLTMLYWFGGFIAMALFLNDRVCFGTVCDLAKVGIAISAVSWIAWAVSLGFGVFRFMKARKSRQAYATGGPKVEMYQGP